jgi:hypothetical protein
MSKVLCRKCLARRVRVERVRNLLQGVSLTPTPMREDSFYSIGKIIYDVGLALARACEAFGESRPVHLNTLLITPSRRNDSQQEDYRELHLLLAE